MLWKQSSLSKPFLHWRVQAVQPLDTFLKLLPRYYEGDVLSLLEVSLDTNLSHNALKLVLRGVGPVLPDVCVQEVGSAHVVVLFATASTVFRLILPHPEAIIKVDCPDIVYHSIQFSSWSVLLLYTCSDNNLPIFVSHF